MISDIFVSGIAQGFIVMVPATILAGLAALIVKNHNLKKRGR
jgi:cellobiose-specific phosphotransferase system component IIC